MPETPGPSGTNRKALETVNRYFAYAAFAVRVGLYPDMP